jgi:hypothetical protein
MSLVPWWNKDWIHILDGDELDSGLTNLNRTIAKQSIVQSNLSLRLDKWCKIREG